MQVYRLTSRHEIAFYGAIKTAFLKHSTVDKKRSDELRNSALRQILNNAIVANGAEEAIKLVLAQAEVMADGWYQ